MCPHLVDRFEYVEKLKAFCQSVVVLTVRHDV